MLAFSSLGTVDRGVALLADDVTEFHLARLLILFEKAGSGTIRGLTKLAKLDFFLRYPAFFERVTSAPSVPARPTESAMVRHFYGPWDHRYYALLNILVARGLLEYSKENRTYVMTLTPEGRDAARTLSASEAYGELADGAMSVGGALGRLTGTALKNMVYREFAEEVGDRRLGDSIE